MDLATLITNTKSMQDGVWMDYLGNIRLLVARMENPNYRAFIQGGRARVLVKDSDLEESSGATEGLLDLMTEAIAETVLLGWENVEFDGDPLEYSKENALRLLRGLPKFRDDVVLMASNVKRFQDEEYQEALDSLRPS